MTQRNLLTLLVTTYNRAILLDALLAILHDYQQRGLGFDIIVCDDYSHDNTMEICRKWEHELKEFSYMQNSANMGMDFNFDRAYQACKTDYCWLLGDSRIVDYEDIETIIRTIESGEYDALMLNCRNEMTLPSTTYTNINVLLSEQGWQITNNAACVIPKRFIRQELYHRYFGTTFLHLGIFVENLCLKEHFKVAFLSEIKVKNLEVKSFKKIGWTRHPFLNFGKLWYEFVMSLPNQVKIEVKRQMLLDHCQNTGFLGVKMIPGLKVAYGKEFVDNYKMYREYIPFITTTPTWVYDLLIRFLPSHVYIIGKAVYLKIKRQIKS